jgi:hypothetical protein
MRWFVKFLIILVVVGSAFLVSKLLLDYWMSHLFSSVRFVVFG